MRLLPLYRMRRMLGLLLVVSVASVVGYYFSLSYAYWLVLGAFIVGVLVFPIRYDQEFKQGLLPVFFSLNAYMQIVTSHFLGDGDNQATLSNQRHELERIMVQQYPEWVYEFGFNPGLREGFRYFLLQLERVTEVVFAMDSIAMEPVNRELIMMLREPILLAMQKNSDLLQAMADKFNDKNAEDKHADYTFDMQELNRIASEVVPPNLELLDIAHDYMAVTAFVRAMNNLRMLLLQLMAAVVAGEKKHHAK